MGSRPNSWLVCISALGFIRKREKYLFLTITLAFLPILCRLYWPGTPALGCSGFEPIYYLLVFGFLSGALLKTGVLMRQRTDETIQLMQTELEQLRKFEIEQIGRSLHDQLGNTLASALGYLTMKTPRVMLARTIILHAINESRVISHNLVKDDNRPLAEKLTDLAERFNDFSPINFF